MPKEAKKTVKKTKETKDETNKAPQTEEAKQDRAEKQEAEFRALFEALDFKAPKIGDVIKGKVISASKSEVKIDINGVCVGIVRGPELYSEDDLYASINAGDEVEATIINEENENGEVELSFRASSEEHAWDDLSEAFDEKKIVKVRVVNANKGGLLVTFRQIPGFLPVSQLAPENYPRVSGGDKSKIFEKLKSFTGRELRVKVVNFKKGDDKIIFSEKDAWTEQQSDNISKYAVGSVVDGTISAIADFGVFVNFDENLEGLIHISELAWQRVDHPGDLFKVGEVIKAEIISMSNSKIFLSAKKLTPDPWENVEKKYQVGQKVKGVIIKVNPFGLFIELDPEIHGLAHISQLGLDAGQKIEEEFKPNQSKIFVVTSLQPKEHRLGLVLAKEQDAPEELEEPKTVAKPKKSKEKEKIEEEKIEDNIEVGLEE